MGDPLRSLVVLAHSQGLSVFDEFFVTRVISYAAYKYSMINLSKEVQK